MEKALSRGIYYIHGNDDSYLKYHIITEIIYDGTNDEFNDVLKSLHTNTQVRNIFGDQDNICYTITNSLSHYYDRLLINQLDVILIVNRYDYAIKIVKNNSDKNNSDKNNSDKNNSNKINQNEKTYDLEIGVIKIDSVIAEFNLNRLINDGNNFKWYSYIKYPIYLIGILGLGYHLYYDDMLFNKFMKSD